MTEDVSHFYPVNVGGKFFPQSEIEQAIHLADVDRFTDYGGCGPIAVMGVFDYFARYLGYSSLLPNPNDSACRIDLAAAVMRNTTYSLGSSPGKYALVFPWRLREAFDKVAWERGFGNTIIAQSHTTLFGGKKDQFWDIVVQNIDQGLPVTLGTGLCCGDGKFAKHYTNVCGYEKWVGFPKDGGEKMEKEFIVARLNYPLNESLYYCDADILNCGQVAMLEL